MHPRTRDLFAPTPTRFARFECKYLITEREADRVRAYVRPYVDPDKHADENGRYEICSLYLDTEMLRLRDETLDGLKDRFKLRIRAYSDRPDDPVFFEVKKRRDRRIEKERARLHRSQIATALLGKLPARGSMPDGERESLESFVARTQLLGALPRVLVRYQREAYVGRYDSKARVTFDRQLRCLSSRRPGAFFGRPGWLPVEPQKIILELKYDERCPVWMMDLVRYLNLQRISYSKYANCAAIALGSGSVAAHAGESA